MQASASAQPNWDMTPYFTAIDGPDYVAFCQALAGDVVRLQEQARALPPSIVQAAGQAAWPAFLRDLESAFSRQRHLESYLDCMGAADARDEAVTQQTGALASLRAGLEKAFVALYAHLRAMSDTDFEALTGHPDLAPVRYWLTRMRIAATHQMGPALEDLAADLGVTGLSAWGRLYDRISGNLTFELSVPGQSPQVLPVSMARTLMGDPDPAVREAALRDSNRAWERMAEPLAACLNAIAGTRLTLYRRRGIDDFLQPALFDAAIERRTLDTMFQVVRARQELPRRYLRHKARLLGRDRLGFQDLSAPMPGSPVGRIPWEQARQQVLDAFGSAYPALRRFAEQAFAQRWIDHEPRQAKRPGGFCSVSTEIGQSRIFMTYHGAMGDVETLAHELGHAFHSWLMRDMRPWASTYPMTLAETASTFAEQLITDATLADADAPASARAIVLDSRLQKAAAFLLNTPMRFDFEHAVYEARQHGELSVSRLRELMLEAQRGNYGDVLADDQLDPWFWASKLHFYITEISFYNFPYTFGYLFSLGIFARVKAEGPSFLERYEELLRMTGSATAEEVARTCLGVDLQSPAFWNASIDLIEADLQRFEAEVASPAENE